MAISSLHNTNPKRQAGPDAPHEGRIRGPVVTNSCDCAISLFTTILHAHFSVLKMPSIERKGDGDGNFTAEGRRNFFGSKRDNMQMAWQVLGKNGPKGTLGHAI